MAPVAGNPQLNILEVSVGEMLAPSLKWAEMWASHEGEQEVRGRSRGEQSRGMGSFWKDIKRAGLGLNVLWAVGTGEELRANREGTKRAQKEETGKGKSTNGGVWWGKRAKEGVWSIAK